VRDSLAPHSVGRSVCVACGRSDRKITKEHFWPHWLIDRASPRSVRWRTKRIDARSATVALCDDCNSSFGRELESPVAKIFSDLESAVGLSDFEAELLVRWLWKFEGLSWLQLHSRCTYSPAFTLRDRVLNQLGSIRSHLCLAVSLLDHIDPTYGDAPVGIDSRHHTGAIFVSGVFCRIALMSDRVSCTVITIRREVLVLVPLGCRRCYCGGSALFLFFTVCRRQGRIIQHSALAGDPGRFGSRGWRQRLAALDRTARCCDHSSPAAGNPRSSLRAVTYFSS
jgi:hypothetical protein